jgi:hypothetical protein
MVVPTVVASNPKCILVSVKQTTESQGITALVLIRRWDFRLGYGRR